MFAHFSSIFQGNLSVNFGPLPLQFNVVYRDEVVIARFQHCWGGGGGGVLCSSDAILVIVSKRACQRMLRLSDPGVPRTLSRIVARL